MRKANTNSAEGSSRDEDRTHPILLVLEHLIPTRRILQREPVCRQIGGVQIAPRGMFQQTWQVLLAVRLGAAQRPAPSS